MFTVTYTPPGGSAVTLTGVQSIVRAPGNDRTQPQAIMCNPGIGGGGQFGKGAYVPLETITRDSNGKETGRTALTVTITVARV